jgi:hypothetical protein
VSICKDVVGTGGTSPGRKISETKHLLDCLKWALKGKTKLHGGLKLLKPRLEGFFRQKDEDPLWDWPDLRFWTLHYIRSEDCPCSANLPFKFPG